MINLTVKRNSLIGAHFLPVEIRRMRLITLEYGKPIVIRCIVDFPCVRTFHFRSWEIYGLCVQSISIYGTHKP